MMSWHPFETVAASGSNVGLAIRVGKSQSCSRLVPGQTTRVSRRRWCVRAPRRSHPASPRGWSRATRPQDTGPLLPGSRHPSPRTLFFMTLYLSQLQPLWQAIGESYFCCLDGLVLQAPFSADLGYSDPGFAFSSVNSRAANASSSKGFRYPGSTFPPLRYAAA